jgi:tetratricopeptide (TPR) repeat protein
MTTASRTRVATAAALLVVAVVALYAPIRHAEYLSMDDAVYVTENPYVRDGITAEGVRNALFGSRGGLWMPLSFLSHMADVSLFGLDPTGPHLVNVALHAANVVLLLFLLVRATGATGPSIAVAALFALHPLRVESVAWIAERKDVLSCFFGLAALHAWVSYARRQTFGRYLAVIALFVLALLSKPMLVTLPALMLLLDCWPLGRLDDAVHPWKRIAGLIAEKIPLLVCAGAAAAWTLVTVRDFAAMTTLAENPLGQRLAHATASYVWYVWKTVWPTRLSFFYPYPTWPAWQVWGSAVLLLGAAVLGVVAWRRARWISIGLAWWAVTLFPVIGLFQAGSQGMADRFTYLPSIGLLVAIAWSLDAWCRTAPARTALTIGAVAASIACVVASARQVAYWQSARTLYERTLAVTASNWIMETELGFQLLTEHEPGLAYAHFEEAVRMEPRFAKAAFGLGFAASALGRPDEAALHYRDTIKIEPTHVKAHSNLGVLLFQNHQTDEALHHLTEAVRYDPDSRDAVANLRFALSELGVADVDRYVDGVRAWAVAVAADRERPGGATYGAGLMGQLVGQHVDAMRGCLDGGTAPTPFDLYVQVAADGAVEEVKALPETQLARCFGDGLRSARAPAPPFAPFHAQIGMRFGG